LRTWFSISDAASANAPAEPISLPYRLRVVHSAQEIIRDRREAPRALKGKKVVAQYVLELSERAVGLEPRGQRARSLVAQQTAPQTAIQTIGAQNVPQRGEISNNRAILAVVRTNAHLRCVTDVLLCSAWVKTISSAAPIPNSCRQFPPSLCSAGYVSAIISGNAAAVQAAYSMVERVELEVSAFTIAATPSLARKQCANLR
jgi:hypothetical protein